MYSPTANPFLFFFTFLSLLFSPFFVFSPCSPHLFLPFSLCSFLLFCLFSLFPHLFLPFFSLFFPRFKKKFPASSSTFVDLLLSLPLSPSLSPSLKRLYWSELTYQGAVIKCAPLVNRVEVDNITVVIDTGLTSPRKIFTIKSQHLLANFLLGVFA